jgi:hypothetical protein
MDGYPELDPWTEKAKLLLRNRERCWISLFVLERGCVLHDVPRFDYADNVLACPWLVDVRSSCL